MGLIRDAVLHLHNEQPLLVDLFSLPTSADSCVVCTNVRTLAGKRPLFVDRSDSFFLFPLPHVRFVEVPASAAGDMSGGVGRHLAPIDEEEPEPELDEDLLRRIRDS
ncbi:MAG: hypothetical protein MUE82_06100 [Chloroflexi bacterium]|jgi:hypothetical protein|nr:hypothetical protein [Chloroflexota bacterium]